MAVPKKIYHLDKQTGRLVVTHSHGALHVSPSAIPAGHSAFARKPVRSTSMRVMPHQVKKLQAMCRESGAGPGMQVPPDGVPVFGSERCRKRWFRHLKQSTGSQWHDKDSFN